MSGTIIDSNVLIDIARYDPDWGDWSTDALGVALSRGPVFINPIVYAELGAAYATLEELEHGLDDPDIQRLDLPWEAAFLAGRAFVDYRRRGGSRRSPMPDFYIGAHAAVDGLDILTRDPRRYAAYFPTVRVVSPSSDA
jgi:predicted nucleic acid-binding protein